MRGVLTVLFMMPGLALGAPDYALEDAAWNGVGYLVETAAEAKVEVTVVDSLDMARLGHDDVLLWLYPQALNDDELMRFVRDGGHVVIADDFGASERFLHALGITRHSRGPQQHAPGYQGIKGLPTLAADGDHFLFYNVQEVVANFPASLSGSGNPVLSFAAGEHLAVESSVGRGAVLVLADPSLFLNEMLRRFYGNKQFAANVMRYYCVHEPCRVHLLLPSSRMTGRYRPRHGPLGGLPRAFDRFAEATNRSFIALGSMFRAGLWPTLLGGLVLLALALYVWRASRAASFPHANRPQRYGVEHGPDPLIREALALANRRAEADFIDAARSLMASFEEDRKAFGRLRKLGVVGPSEASMVSERIVERTLLRIQGQAASVNASSAPFVSAEQFLRLYDQVLTVRRYVDQLSATLSRHSRS